MLYSRTRNGKARFWVVTDTITLSESFRRMFFTPRETLVRKWNWKSAVFSSSTRAILFFCANLAAGWRAAMGALLTELLFRGVTSGFYGAMTQNFRKVAPAWQAAVTVMILLPLSSHSLEFLVHYLRHTPKLTTSIVSSVIFTAFSTLFNWYAMRKGALVVGTGSQSVGRDLLAMPKIVGQFCAALPLYFWRRLRTIHEPQNSTSDQRLA